MYQQMKLHDFNIKYLPMVTGCNNLSSESSIVLGKYEEWWNKYTSIRSWRLSIIHKEAI
jgi:hypothetical protein